MRLNNILRLATAAALVTSFMIVSADAQVGPPKEELPRCPTPGPGYTLTIAYYTLEDGQIVANCFYTYTG